MADTVIRVADSPPDEIRPIRGLKDASLMSSINAVLDTIPDKTFAAVVQVPEDGKLKGALYLNAGNGLSFATWIDKDLRADSRIGYGVAVRKTWAPR